MSTSHSFSKENLATSLGDSKTSKIADINFDFGKRDDMNILDHIKSISNDSTI